MIGEAESTVVERITAASTSPPQESPPTAATRRERSAARPAEPAPDAEPAEGDTAASAEAGSEPGSAPRSSGEAPGRRASTEDTNAEDTSAEDTSAGGDESTDEPSDSGAATREASGGGSADSGRESRRRGSDRATDSDPDSGAPAGRRRRRTDRGFHDLHSGHKLAGRYRLEECITRLDGFSSWRAVDENLRRAVGVHVLPADHPRAPAVLAAARSAALLTDPRFVQVLDADQHGDLVHVIHEWLPDAVPLSNLLHNGPLPAHEAAVLLRQLAEAMTAAHREGLAHLRLTPVAVLRSGAGPFRIRGLAVDAALRGISHERPERADTEAIGALLYAALTQRWPYPDGGYGLQGVTGLERGSPQSLAAPDQVRAGVHRQLSDLAMRALTNDGATAASEQRPCVCPQDLVKAAAALPRIPPPEPGAELLASYQPTSYHQGSYRHGGPPSARPPHRAATAPPALPGRTGAVLKWGVSALLIVALGLGSWQIADTLMGGDSSAPAETNPPTDSGGADGDGGAEDPAPEDGPVEIREVIDFDPYGPNRGQNPQAAPHAIDGDPSTYWHTKNYFGPRFANLKSGTGLILDLGSPQEVSSVSVDTLGTTDVQLLAAPPTTMTTPTSFEEFELVAEGSGESLALAAEEPLQARYLLVWLTELPQGSDGLYRGRISNIVVSR